MARLGYLPHIDGLRAIAVLSVIFYHLDSRLIPGGYLGVDIFFVISGFLITGIIYKEKLDSKFTYLDFYKRRIKRIIPALYTMLLLVLIAGYFILLPYDYFKTSISSISVLMFLSNIQYSLRTGDYFSGDAEEWPLLHTWSLAIEEQYYFILPLLFSAVFMYKKQKYILPLLFFICGLSFISAEIISRLQLFNSSNYFLFTSRMGELFIGSILAIYSQNKKLKSDSNIAAYISIIIITCCLFLIDEEYPFPGFYSFLLCTPVAILIASPNTVVSKVLSSKYLILIGLISYSLYLYHWPIMAFVRYIFSYTHDDLFFNLNQIIFILVTTFSLSLLSYYCVEKPLRKTKKTKTVYTSIFIIPSTIILAMSVYIYINQGAPSRLDRQNSLSKYEYNHIDKEKCPSLVNLGCEGGDLNSSKVIYLYGNSHAEHYFEVFHMLGITNNFKVN